MECFSSVDCRTRLLGPATVKHENHRRLINREFDLSYDNTQHHRQAISNQHLTRLPISTTSFTHRPHSPTIPPPPRAEDAEVQCELLSSVFMRIGGSGLDVTAPNPPSTDTSFQRQRHNSRNGFLPCRSKSPHTRLDLDPGVVQAVPHCSQACIKANAADPPGPARVLAV